LEDINPVQAAIEMGLINDNADAMDALSSKLEKVIAFSVNG
jgi:hypothetical protein